MWTLLWEYKAWVILAVVIIGAALALGIMKMSLDMKTGELSKKEALLEIVQRQNQVLSQNAAAVQDQGKRINEIRQTADQIRKIVTTKITPEGREALNNESIANFNDCMADFFNDGLLRPGCDPPKAAVPKAANPGAI